MLSDLRRTARELGKGALSALAFHSGALPRLAGARLRASGARVQVLAFHRVVDDLDALSPSVIRSLCVTTASFERLCRRAALDFEVLPLAEAAAVVRGHRRARRDVLALTFDDGYRDVYLRAWPVLRRLGLPATVFVPSDYIGTERPLEHDRLHGLLVLARARRCDLSRARAPVSRPLRSALARAEAALHRPGEAAATLAALETLIALLPADDLARAGDALEAHLGERVTLDPGAHVMTAAELRSLSDGGLALGAHTAGHVVLTHEPPARVERELGRPKAELEALAGRPCEAFAYCNGRWSRPLVEAVRAAGYQVAVTTEDRPSSVGGEPLLLGRKSIWEGHVRGLGGGYSETRAAAHLHHLFGVLGLARAISGRADRDGADDAGGPPWRPPA